ncbi:MAG: hypothetical protein KDA98_02105, partial [Acidimicrobiales bacterium]|nr:hypothetical protein [Acidimicrobiales bacterium]
GAAIAVRVNGADIVRVDGQVPRKLTLREADFDSMAAAGDDRQFRFGGVEFRARASRNPFGGTIALAAPEGGAEKLKGRAGSRVELDPGLAGSWVFLLDSDQTRRAGQGDSVGLLIAFVAEGEFARQSERLLADVEARLPETAARLSGLLAQVKRKPTPSKRRRGGDDEAADGADEPAEVPDEASIPDDVPTPEVDEVDEVAASAEDRSVPVEEAPEVADAAATEPADEPAEAPRSPAAPAGFGGAAGAGVDPREAAGTGPDDPDEGPSGPPVGFGGGRSG